MTSRRPCLLFSSNKIPSFGTWFLFFCKSFRFCFKIQMWIHCSRHSFNVFSISARLPILPRPDLVLVTEWMNVLQKRNTKIDTGIIQDPCKLYDVEFNTYAKLLPNHNFLYPNTTRLRSFCSTVRSVQVRSNFFYLAWQWLKERGIISICIGANWLGAATCRSDPTVERSDGIPTKTKHIPLIATKL